MFVGSTFLAKNKNGIAKGPKKKPIIAQNDLFTPLLDAIKYNKPAKQTDITNRTKYPILNLSVLRQPTDDSCLRLFIPLWPFEILNGRPLSVYDFIPSKCCVFLTPFGGCGVFNLFLIFVRNPPGHQGNLKPAMWQKMGNRSERNHFGKARIE